MDGTGTVYDCVPIDQQPSLRGTSESVPTHPTCRHWRRGSRSPGQRPPRANWTAQRQSGRQHARSRADRCLRERDELSRGNHSDATGHPRGPDPFGTLPGFFAKAPRTVAPPAEDEPATVRNPPLGPRLSDRRQRRGPQLLNLWQPSIGANQIFSLSQHWYTAGSGAGLQTRECGWQVYPDFLPRRAAASLHVLDGGRLQVDGLLQPHLLGIRPDVLHVRPRNGRRSDQRERWRPVFDEVAYSLTGGRWWLYYNGTSGSNAIGYYPVTLYGGGPLASKATEIDYGGETVGTTSFPPWAAGRSRTGLAARRIPADRRVLATAWRCDNQRESDAGPGVAQLLRAEVVVVRSAQVRDALVRRPGRRLLAGPGRTGWGRGPRAGRRWRCGGGDGCKVEPPGQGRGAG